jgi:hypothetical protein
VTECVTETEALAVEVAAPEAEEDAVPVKLAVADEEGVAAPDAVA